MTALWDDNRVQFPRLLSEIYATLDFSDEQRRALCEAMDLSEDELMELFERADDEWQVLKEEHRARLHP